MLSVNQVWEELGGIDVITKQAVYMAAERGDFPSLRLGKRILIPREPFETWLKGKITQQRNAA
jgi:excisionase family DNA binding protein